MHKLVIDGLTVDIVRKQIKNLHLGVYPPHGRVRVAAPQSMDDEVIRLCNYLETFMDPTTAKSLQISGSPVCPGTCLPGKSLLFWTPVFAERH